jgi:cytochrome c553
VLRDPGIQGNVETKRIVLALMLLAISLLSALLTHAVLTSTALAQPSNNHVCPLSDEQAQKSVQAFDKIANAFAKEPRCVNCHGAVDPFAADAKETHGGGKLAPTLKKKLNTTTGETESIQDEIATIQQCATCHGAFPGIWRLPRPALFFVGKDAFTLCKDERNFFGNSETFINHIEHDVNPDNPFIQEAFKCNWKCI